ncbi:MAG: class I SAM-dependent methyltransferase [Methylomarinum sp.]|nr:class I SAM-dependent methyltransferase [Methylomarinum sp.]
MKKNIGDILSLYPKKRPPLSVKHQERFELDYKTNREGSSGIIGRAAQRLERWMHIKVASTDSVGVTLEVGAGTLNHLKFESHSQPYDIVEPFKELYLGKHEECSRIRTIYSRLADIPKHCKYSRIISIATLEHMLELPDELAIMHDKLEPGGIFQAGIPSEGGLLWGLSWRLTTGMSYRLRTGLSYSSIMKFEHVNTADEILSLVKHYFSDVKYERFPINNKHLSFYTYITARK